MPKKNSSPGATSASNVPEVRMWPIMIVAITPFDYGQETLASLGTTIEENLRAAALKATENDPKKIEEIAVTSVQNQVVTESLIHDGLSYPSFVMSTAECQVLHSYK